MRKEIGREGRGGGRREGGLVGRGRKGGKREGRGRGGREEEGEGRGRESDHFQKNSSKQSSIS
jgi:hypothetical protein